VNKIFKFVLIPFIIFLVFTVRLDAQEVVSNESISVKLKNNTGSELQFSPVRTDSPRETFKTFVYLMNKLDNLVANYGLDSATDNDEAYAEILLIFEQANALMMLPEEVSSHRKKFSLNTVAYLIDIFGRIDLPNEDDIPGIDDAEVLDNWRVPESPIRIVKVMEGSRIGEFLFDENTHLNAPRFYRGISHLPLRTSADIKSWTNTLPQITGPMIPANFINNIPMSFKKLWMNTPIWKLIITLMLTFVLVGISFFQYWLLRRKVDTDSVKGAVRSSFGALIILLIFYWSRSFIEFQLNLSGDFLVLIYSIFTIMTHLAAAWLFWWAVQAIFLFTVNSHALDSAEIEYPLILVLGKIISFLGVIFIISSGIQELGLSLFSLAASLGVGGIAVALSIRPTLENMIGGVILYLDKPVRIGDFCTFGDKTGTVENIGIRTIKIRAINRTLITIPNAAFADMELINWAHCDKMMIRTTIPLRFNTDPDQLRYLLVTMREMCHAHPKVDNETIRIRLIGFGDSSMDVDFRIYTLTHEWNEFFSVREDIFLRVKDLISEAGVSFAIPTQTLQMAPSEVLDEAKAKAASKTVKSWRRSRKLPFPGLSTDRMTELKGTLDWPPRGSFDSAETLEAQEPIEPLSKTTIETTETESSEKEKEESKDKQANA
jgi:MscS family membrane protein